MENDVADVLTTRRRWGAVAPLAKWALAHFFCLTDVPAQTPGVET
jgi:hypothetical protein